MPHSQPAAFNKELITLPSTCVRLLEASTWVFPGPAAPRVARCIHPMPVAAPAQSGCLRGGPWRLLSLGRRTWCTKGPPLSEAGEAARIQHPHQSLQEQQEPHGRLSRKTPVCVRLGRQDAACVRGGEDQPAAEGELLLPPVCLVSALSEL